MPEVERFSNKLIYNIRLSSLRQEEHLFDVTLVSDDEQHILAHKLVLTASSELFKNILKKAKHSNPMIFLSGYKSKDLLLVMDYIYQGEVQILQTDWTDFCLWLSR